MKQGTEVSESTDKALHIAGVGTRLFGVYSPEEYRCCYNAFSFGSYIAYHKRCLVAINSS